MPSLPRLLLRAEGLAILVGAVALYFHLGFGWPLLVVLALAPDLAALGYLAGPRVGSAAYDVAHTEVWPIALAVGGVVGGTDSLVQVALIWLVHIGTDRALGYGLKYTTGFKDTHLQRVSTVQIGAHLSAAGGIDTAIDRAEAINAECVQVFTQSPRMWKHTVHSPEAIERFKARRAEAGIGGVVCHALYLCNLGATDRDIYDRSVTAMCATVDTAVAIEADGVIFHVGSHLGGGLDASMKQVVRALRKILERCKGDTWLLIENSAGAGGTIGRSLGELAQLVGALDGHERLGICLDSCHLYASGYDVTDRAVLDEVVAEVGATIGLDRLRALHVNDSATPLGSNRDRHADVLEGEMGKGMGVFLAHPAFQGLSAYLETPGKDGHGPSKADLTRVRRLRARSLAR